MRIYKLYDVHDYNMLRVDFNLLRFVTQHFNYICFYTFKKLSV